MQEPLSNATAPEARVRIIISRVIHYICIPVAPANFSCAKEAGAVQSLQAADRASNRALLSPSQVPGALSEPGSRHDPGNARPVPGAPPPPPGWTPVRRGALRGTRRTAAPFAHPTSFDALSNPASEDAQAEEDEMGLAPQVVGELGFDALSDLFSSLAPRDVDEMCPAAPSALSRPRDADEMCPAAPSALSRPGSLFAAMMSSAATPLAASPPTPGPSLGLARPGPPRSPRPRRPPGTRRKPPRRDAGVAGTSASLSATTSASTTSPSTWVPLPVVHAVEPGRVVSPPVFHFGEASPAPGRAWTAAELPGLSPPRMMAVKRGTAARPQRCDICGIDGLHVYELGGGAMCSICLEAVAGPVATEQARAGRAGAGLSIAFVPSESDHDLCSEDEKCLTEDDSVTDEEGRIPGAYPD